MSVYDGVATRMLARITEKGGPVTFPGVASGTPAIYDPLTDTFSGGSTTDATGQGLQINGDPSRFAALKLVLDRPVTLMIAAKGLAVTPVSGMQMIWANDTTTVKDVEPIGPDGAPIVHIVTGSH